MIWGSMVWNMMESARLDTETLAQLMLGTLAAMPPDADWADAGSALIDSAYALADAGEIDFAQLMAIAGAAVTRSRLRPGSP